MNTQEEILSFLDLLDLDEEIIDTRLKTLMVRSNHTNQHLKSVIQLLQYKALINTQEDGDCENDDEFNFIVQLLLSVNDTNVDYVCKIINIVLSLNESNIINKSEHLIQQILSDTDFQTDRSDANSFDGGTCSKTLINLKICGSILDAIIKINGRLSLIFLETKLEKILDSTDEKLKLFFLTNTVPRLFEGSVGYDILDRIWNYSIQLKREQKEKALTILSCLSDYYLPIPDTKGQMKYESEIIFLPEFWDIILYGIASDNTSIRKISVYLSKRALDSVITIKKDINIKTETQNIFFWNANNSKRLKQMWDNYFVLIDSLEEKQSNIVLPSLKLFETIDIGERWLNAAFNIGLRHDNTQVRLKCIQYKFKTKIREHSEATVLLEALNDVNIYDSHTYYRELKIGMTELLRDNTSFLVVFKAIPSIKWSPVPFYHITDILANLERKISNNIADEITAILKVQCNNLVIRSAVSIKLLYFIKHCCENLSWRDIVNISSLVQDLQKTTEFISIVKQIKIKENEIYACFKDLSENVTNIDLILTYLVNNEENIDAFISIIHKKILKLNEAVLRQYSDKKESITNAIFLLHLLNKTKDNPIVSIHGIHSLIAKQNKTILQYMVTLFSCDVDVTIEDATALFDRHNWQFLTKDLENILQHLNKIPILILNDNPDLHKAVLSIFTIKMLIKNQLLVNKYKHEMLDLNRFLRLISDLKFRDVQNESVGRLKNVFYEKSCEIIYIIIEAEENVQSCINQLIIYIENILECGGYGCLKWILKIVSKIVKNLVNDNKYNMIQFINRVWNEIEELKSNNQYLPCMEEFVELITQDAILEKAMYNNIVILYCNKIIDYGPVKTNPIYYLTKKLNTKDVKNFGHLIYILCEILLYCPVSRKDQRITDNVCLQIMQDPKFDIKRKCQDMHFNFEIQYLSITTLCRINDEDTLNVITKFITNKIDEIFRNKQRYHGNSQTHKILLAALQHILIIFIKSMSDLDWLLNWCLDLLVKLPHQPSVRICLEWLVALHFYIKKLPLNEENLQILKSKNVPLNSQFFIMYWILKHKISNSTYVESEYNFVLDFLLSYTMGQLFNVRLHAQYLATILHKLVKKSTKFDYVITVIEKTFTDSCTDKNYVKLKGDYFANSFDIVANLNPHFIYYLLPKYCDIDNEKVNFEFVKSIMKDINDCLVCGNEEFIVEWEFYRRNYEEFSELDIRKGADSKIVEEAIYMGTIQKKYIPWKNMSDINVYDVEKKLESPSELIVVASLIDKLPNLGGMARTSEVFGVKTYVVDSLRHLQDKQFQGLSISAERWINIEEVRPGRPLKEYLMQKKTEGYSIVAAEQTSTSTKLQAFKFPKKTLLLLGHEKEGIPCDLLPIMDHCVEIPQQGYVRSLNVHVTAAIFVWEYARQNVL